ncbi:MAG: dockerin type I repeat-containing protein [Ruminococcus sp.]|nr:dockerin type I repeat-containing protein [Ruminococcus sp.]MDE6848971.1 dockerin type I repeat-containing protein [Ruminococcus sp.]
MITSVYNDDMTWHDAVRDTVLNYGEDVYFGDKIKMLCLMIDDGGWIVLDILGDVNEDGKFRIADIVAMQKYIINEKQPVILNLKAGDINKDGSTDVFDLCLMKNMIISKL